MIEQALRKHLKPTVEKQKRLYLALRLSTCWIVAALLGGALLFVDWYWHFRSSTVTWGLCAATVIATFILYSKSRRMEPDYRKVARDIETKYPDIRALLSAALEQKPSTPGGQLGYLQEKVISEALVHAIDNNWLKSVPTRKMLFANLARLASFLLLIAAISTLMPSIRSPFGLNKYMPDRRPPGIEVTPGDTTVETGTPVVILARFNEHIPPGATLLYGPAPDRLQQMKLTKNLDERVFGGIIQDVQSDLIYRVEFENSQTQDYTISTYKPPALERADAKIVYPEYTGLAEETIKNTRRISVVERSDVTLTFTINKPVASARLIPKEGDTVDLTVDAEYPNVYKASFTAAKTQRYELNLTDAQDRKNKIPPRFAINVNKNMPAKIKPLFPNRDIQASPLEEVSLEAQAWDDYEITGYGLSYTIAGQPPTDIAMGDSLRSNDKHKVQYLLELEKLNARPDQLITYHFWADDVNAAGKPRRSMSDMYFAEIRHFEEIFRQSQQSQSAQQQQQQQQDQQDRQNQQSQQAEQLVKLQKQIINATWNIKRQADLAGALDDHKDDVEVVRQSQDDALNQAKEAMTNTEDAQSAQALQAAAEHMQSSVTHLTQTVESTSAEELATALSTEQAAYQELLKLRKREHQIAQSQNSSSQSASQSTSARSQQQLQQMELKERQDRYESERLAREQNNQAQQQDLQMLNRLRELARHQNEMSEKLKELQTALKKAQTEQQKEESLRQLKRLRDEQVASLQDADELSEQMEQTENRQRTSETREQLAEARSRINQSAEELEKAMLSRAITTTTRTGRQLDEMRQDLEQRTSGQFNREMTDMREQARQLDREQKDISGELNKQTDGEYKKLEEADNNTKLADRLDEQKGRTEELMNRMKDVSEQAEVSEPLLSQRLYDTVRNTSTENIDQALDISSQLLRRNFLPQAMDVEKKAAQAIEDLRKGVEQAAEGILGDEAQSLQLAQQQLENLIDQVSKEAARALGANRQQQDNPDQAANNNQNRQPGQQPGSQDRQQSQNPDSEQNTQQNRQPGSQSDPQQNANNQPRQQQNNQPGSQPGQGQQNQNQSAQNRQNQPGSQNGDPQQQDNRTAQNNQPRPGGSRTGGTDQMLPDQWGGRRDEFNGPLTGDDYRQWSNRLREVEEMLTETPRRQEVSRVRDRAKAMRAEFIRHSKEPKWDQVKNQIIKPLTELQKQIANTLAELESDKPMTPIDRDPVPERYADLVKDYFENLGAEN